MAWLSSNSLSPTDSLHADQLNSLANDIRNWGGDVNGGGHHLSNVIIDGYSPPGGGVALLSPAQVIPSGGQPTAVMWFDTTDTGGNSTPRWQIGKDGSSETGANAGANFAITRYSDTGIPLSGTPFAIRRSDGLVTIGSQQWTGPINGGGQTISNVVISGVMQDPTTTKGDLIVHGSGGTTRIGVGADGFILIADSTQALGLKWAAAPATGVPTTRQIIAGAGMSGGGTLAADVTLNALVTSIFGRTGAVVLTAADITGATGVLSTRKINTGTGLSGGGDLSADRTLTITPDTVNQQVQVSLAGALVGTRHNINFIQGANTTLTVADNSGANRVDVTIVSAGGGGGGLTDPTTTKGDLIVHGSGGTTRIGVGADGQVLTADSTQTLGVKWAAASGGGSQTPWTQNINAASFTLSSVGGIGIGMLAQPNYALAITTAAPSYAVTVTTTATAAMSGFHFQNTLLKRFDVGMTDSAYPVPGLASLGVINSADTDFALATNNAQRMRITSAGVVIIGSQATPVSGTLFLSVRGPVELSNSSYTDSAGQQIANIYFCDSFNATSPIRAGITVQLSGTTAGKKGGDLLFTTAPETGSLAAERMRINSNGNVFVGAASLASGLAVAPLTVATASGTNTTILFATNGAALGAIGMKSGDPNFYFTNTYYTGGSVGDGPSLTLAASGRLGVFNASPGYALERHGGSEYHRDLPAQWDAHRDQRAVHQRHDARAGDWHGLPEHHRQGDAGRGVAVLFERDGVRSVRRGFESGNGTGQSERRESHADRFCGAAQLLLPAQHDRLVGLDHLDRILLEAKENQNDLQRIVGPDGRHRISRAHQSRLPDFRQLHHRRGPGHARALDAHQMGAADDGDARLDGLADPADRGDGCGGPGSGRRGRHRRGAPRRGRNERK